MNDKVSYSKLAIDAMYRASQAAHDKAAERKLDIPVWQNGQIVYITPKSKKTITNKAH